MRRRLRDSQGFTLVEISIVIVIITILLSVSAPGLKRFAASSKLKSDAKTIRTLLNYARDVAITEHEGYLVVFDLDAQEYWLVSSSEFDPEDPRTILTEGADPSLSATSAGNEGTNSQSSPSTQTPLATRTSMIAKIPQRPSQRIQIASLYIDHGSLEPTQPISAGIDYVYFGPQGETEDMELYLQDTNGRTLQMNMTSATGRVRFRVLSPSEAEELGLEATEMGME